MSDTDTTVSKYIQMWNESDPARRRELVAQVVTEDASYLDPVMAGEGIDGISEMIGGAQAQFPGHSFALHSGPDGHHDRVRFSWSLAANGGEPVAIGTDYVTLDGDGRMQAITGFIDVAP